MKIVRLTPEEHGALNGLLRGVKETEDYKNTPALLRSSFDSLIEAIQDALDNATEE